MKTMPNNLNPQQIAQLIQLKTFLPFAQWKSNALTGARKPPANQLGQDNIQRMIRRYRQTGANPIGRSVMLGNPGVQQILRR